MKFGSDYILFTDLMDFSSFSEDLDLIGQVKLKEAVIDNSENILIKENMVINRVLLEKLYTHRDRFKPKISIHLNDTIFKQINIHLTDKIIKLLDEPENSFISHLYQDIPYNYKAYISTSFRYPKLALAAYLLYREKPLFFNHIAGLALLTLGIAFQKNIALRMIHRYSFIAGLCADMALSSSDPALNAFETDENRKNMIRRSADYADGLSIPLGISNSIRNHYLSTSNPEVLKSESLPESVKAGESPEFNSSEKNQLLNDVITAPITDDAEREELEDETREIIAEILKIARFVNDINYKVTEREFFAEEMIYMLAYNAARGYFYKELIEPIVERYQEYEKKARHMMQIAYVERKCIHPPSAWAYPKPNASQVLCRKKIYDCPMIEKGGEIHIISSQDAYGRIGDSLAEDSYPKCLLESELQGELPERSKNSN